MSESGFSFLAYAVAWATVIVGVWFLFEKAEETVSPEVRATAARWLQNLDPATVAATWPAAFAAAFDHIFDERHLSWRCFRRSCAASLAAVLCVLVIWAALRPGESSLYYAQVRASPWVGLVAPLLVLLPTLIINFLPDYVSLFETRYVVGRIAKGGSASLWLVLDLIVTALIASSVYVLVLLGLGIPAESGDVLRIVLSLSAADYGAMCTYSVQGEASTACLPLGIWFYSAFFTSIWVWVFVAAGFAVKLTGRLDRWLGWVRSVLEVEEKPFRSLGFTAILLLTLGFVVALPFLG